MGGGTTTARPASLFAKSGVGRDVEDAKWAVGLPPPVLRRNS